jgi:hypothetical protein
MDTKSDDDDDDNNNNNNNNNRQNAIKTQTFGSLTYFTLHIRSSPFTISAGTHIISDLHIFLSLSSSSILLVAG